jgi:hypothetical protein
VPKPEEDRCARCGKTRDEVRLEKCSVCYSMFCRVCASRRHGKTFCSVHCADIFFFGDEEQE